MVGRSHRSANGPTTSEPRVIPTPNNASTTGTAVVGMPASSVIIGEM